MTTFIMAAAALAAFLPLAALAQGVESGAPPETARQVSTHVGEMSMALDAGGAGAGITERLRFEPYQQLEEMFLRDDVVYLMRHGPTDWSKLDEKDVAPTDCVRQRVMSEEGKDEMRQLGALMASNDILPSRIVVSEWCRNQQTVEQLLDGVEMVDPEAAESMPVETDPDLNLLLSLQGVRDVEGLREQISSWTGDPEREGPLLLVTHYTDIEELTQFRVFEGEILVLDPKRDNLVLGYVRLQSAGPDVGHFEDVLASPLLAQSEALDMVERYYAAIGGNDRDALESLLSDGWIGHGSEVGGVQDVAAFLDEVEAITGGLSDATFEIEDVRVSDDVVTVIGRIGGRHTGEIYDIAPTGRDVSFSGIAVHRVEDGQIAETWQMADRLSLLRQISE